MFGRVLETENRNYPSLHHLAPPYPTLPLPSTSTGQEHITKLIGSCLQIYPQVSLTVAFINSELVAINQLRQLPVAISPNHPGTHLSYVRTGCWPSTRKQFCILRVQAAARRRTQTCLTSKPKACPRLTKQRSQQPGWLNRDLSRSDNECFLPHCYLKQSQAICCIN